MIDVDTLEAMKAALLNTISGACFGRVETFDRTTQIATVQPYMTRRVRDVETDEPAEPEKLPLRSVRVLSLQAGGFAVVFPVAVGDSVLILTLESDHGPHELGGGEADALDWRKHHPGMSIAIPMALARALVPSWAGEAYADGCLVVGGSERKNQVRFTSDGIELGGPSPVEVALGPKVQDALNAIVAWSATATPGTLSGTLTPAVIAAVNAAHVKAK
jgi:hypothetical protein